MKFMLKFLRGLRIKTDIELNIPNMTYFTTPRGLSVGSSDVARFLDLVDKPRDVEVKNFLIRKTCTFLSCLLAFSCVHAQKDTSGQEFISKAQEELMAQLNKRSYTKLELTAKTKQVIAAIPLSQFKIQIQDRYPPLPQTCVRFNDSKHSIPIWFKIKAYQQVLVAKHSIKSRTLISSNDFVLENQNIAGLNNSPYQQVPAQTWLKKPISKGTVLTEDYLNKKPDIVNGQSVQVHIKSQGITIHTEAIAQHDAYLGQAIKIKNVRSNKLFMAVVTAANEVEVNA